MDAKWRPAVQGYSQRESTERLSPFRNEAGEHVLQEILACDQRREYGSYVERTIVSIARLDVRVAIMMHCLVEKEKHAGCRHKGYTVTYGTMMDNATKQLIKTESEFVENWF